MKNCGNQIRNGKTKLGLFLQQVENCKTDEELELIKKLWGEEKLKWIRGGIVEKHLILVQSSIL